MTLSPIIAAKLSSRICHDLISPVGAVVNGVDLIREIGGGNVSDELTMISQSANRASSILQFYRIAFGVADPRARVAKSDLIDRAQALVDTHRIKLNSPNADFTAVTRPFARLTAQLILCARALLGMRGEITVTFADESETACEIEITGDITQDGVALTGMLVSGAGVESLDPRQIEFALASDTAGDLGIRLDASHAEGSVRLATAR